MKIRLGFVSNSSSSSFVIFGKRMEFDDVKEHKYKGSPFGLGHDYCYEGVDFFELDERMIMFLAGEVGEDIKDKLEFFDVYYVGGEDDDEIKKSDLMRKLPAKFEVIPIEASYHKTENVKDLEERYGRDN